MSVGELSVKFWVYNLFDEEYVSGFPADARPQFRPVHRHHAALGQEKR
ncbi:MAG: hypothetical protein ACLR76_08465 [Alistipes sp.]